MKSARRSASQTVDAPNRGVGPRYSVRTRLTLWNVGILAMILLVMGAAFWGIVRARLIRGLDYGLAGYANHAAERWLAGYPNGRGIDALAAHPSPRGATEGRSRAPASALLQTGLRMVPAPGPSVLVWTGDSPWDMALYARSLRGAEGYAEIHVGPEDARVYSLPVRRGGQIVGVVQ